MTNTDALVWVSILPLDILKRAYRASNGELAWPGTDATAVVKILQANGFSILGVDIWLPTRPRPTIPTPFVYDWSAAYAIPALEFISEWSLGSTSWLAEMTRPRQSSNNGPSFPIESIRHKMPQS
ncbi:MAG: hypothetical protein ABSA13_09060 [Beijerinckiaceae bacterium]|jgi:hypothetical protein